MERDAAQLLKIADDAEEIARLRIAARANTPESGSSAAYRSPRKFLEADGRVEGVAQDRLAGVDIAKLGDNA